MSPRGAGRAGAVRTPPRLLALLALVLVLVLALAASLLAGGCGDQTSGSGTAATAPADDTLTVRLLREQTLIETLTLDCAGADRATCAEVARLLPRLRPDPNEACTQIYGGPERIVLSGQLAGERVRLEVGRTDGCAIARYDLLAAALGR